MQQMQPLDSSMMSSCAAGFPSASAQHFAVDAEIAELVDDQRDSAAMRSGQEIADQRRLAGAEKAGDDGGGDLFGIHHGDSCFSTIGRPAATK